MEHKQRVALGKKYRILGRDHELQVRKLLEENGWIVSNWKNNIDLQKKAIVKAGFNRFNPQQGGFPDFICFRPLKDGNYMIKFVECKIQGTKGLTKEEKEKIMILFSLTGATTDVL